MDNFLGYTGLIAVTIGAYLITKISNDPMGAALLTYGSLSIIAFTMNYITTRN